MENETASVHIQARLTPTEFEPFKAVIDEFGITKAKLFRQVILSNEKNLVIVGDKSDKTHDEYKKRMVYLANKTSNNVNQLAKRLNEAYRGGVVSERNYNRMMNDLIGITSTFKKGIDKC